jgi:hypothetical protein
MKIAALHLESNMGFITQDNVDRDAITNLLADKGIELTDLCQHLLQLILNPGQQILQRHLEALQKELPRTLRLPGGNLDGVILVRDAVKRWEALMNRSI